MKSQSHTPSFVRTPANHIVEDLDGRIIGKVESLPYGAYQGLCKVTGHTANFNYASDAMAWVQDAHYSHIKHLKRELQSACDKSNAPDVETYEIRRWDDIAQGFRKALVFWGELSPESL